MIKAIIFDCDGTLVDSETLSAIATDHAFKSILKRPLTEEESRNVSGIKGKEDKCRFRSYCI